MRAGLSTIQQTLAPEAAAVITNSIAEAAKRNHGQTTPLHVAATLLSTSGGILRLACVRSHPNTSHPLQCRALELCFSVALDRLQSAAPATSSEPPPISNALMAALKRAQAHQRRGCPEQQQSPLLAVKVDLEQLVVSILDDPSVSRVMKEASFSSPAVKAAIKNSISASPATQPHPIPSPSCSAATSSARNVYLNPRLHPMRPQQKHDGGSSSDGNKVMEILTRKRNAVLVGDSDLTSVMKEVLDRIRSRELGCSPRIISLGDEIGSVSDRSLIPAKIRELGSSMESCIGNGIVIDLGDLKWLVESPGGSGPTKAVTEMGRVAVSEMAAILRRFREGRRVWLVGTAACSTYLRCQVYHSSMESDWDLQAVPIAPRSPLPGLFPRLGNNGVLSTNNGILNKSIEALAMPKVFSPPMKSISTTTPPLRFPPETTTNPSQRQTLCPQCTEDYERELAKLVAEESEKSSSDSIPEPRPSLPKWLQIAAPSSAKGSPDRLQSKEHELSWKQKMEELTRKWRQTCSRLHPNTSSTRSFQPKLSLGHGFPPLRMGNLFDPPGSPPKSPVKTDLVLGNQKPPDTLPWEKAHWDRIRDFPGCKQDKLSNQGAAHQVSTFEDSDSIKRLFKGLMEKVEWQADAASAVTSAIMQSKSGNGKRRGVMPKSDTWLLFVGPDKVGKSKMANALSELVFGSGPITVRFGSPRTAVSVEESNVHFRGKTPVDRISEAIRQNPFSVIVLEDIDRADAVVRGTIKRAIERGRLPDSYGREVGLGSVIFVLTANCLPDDIKNMVDDSVIMMEEKILNSADHGWQLELSVGEKRRPDWLLKVDQPEKRRKDLGLSLDLNLATGGNSRDEATCESSWNSSDLTVENDNEQGRLVFKKSKSPALEFLDSVDHAIVFKPVDFGPLRRRISDTISGKFAGIIGGKQPIQIDDNVLDRMVGGVWVSGVRFEEWTERVLVPTIEQLRRNLSVDDDEFPIRLSSLNSKQLPQKSSSSSEWLPQSVTLAIEGV